MVVEDQTHRKAITGCAAGLKCPGNSNYCCASDGSQKCGLGYGYQGCTMFTDATGEKQDSGWMCDLTFNCQSNSEGPCCDVDGFCHGKNPDGNCGSIMKYCNLQAPVNSLPYKTDANKSQNPNAFCGNDQRNNGRCASAALCCSEWGDCDYTAKHCNVVSGNYYVVKNGAWVNEGVSGTVPCGNGIVGNGLCDAATFTDPVTGVVTQFGRGDLCCNSSGYCGNIGSNGVDKFCLGDGIGTGSTTPVRCTPADNGYADADRGWYDAQGLGVANDYCRNVGNYYYGAGSPSNWFSCKLAGHCDQEYTSQGVYTLLKVQARCTPVDFGYSDADRGWYDARGVGVANDYCRWVGTPRWFSCKLAGHCDQEYTAAGVYTLQKVQGHTLVIRTAGGAPINLAEIKVTGASGVLVATLSDTLSGYPASNCVDNIYTNFCHSGSFGASLTITYTGVATSIVVTNRVDCCKTALMVALLRLTVF